ncbi:MAG: hypothetical protein NUV61_03910 [Candidatus Azambacteria bacterium]|nr:hypothetical protein [Candidatus Azambacteria bacterium]
MEFLSPGSVLKEGSAVIIVGVYTDKITVSSVRREKGNVVVTATATEPQEGEAISGGILDVERIALSCRKALVALPTVEGGAARNVVFALGGGVGLFSSFHGKEIRATKEKKISTEELATLIGIHAKEKEGETSRRIAERFHIDGFAVTDPVGLNGEEVLIDVVRVACADTLAQSLSHVAAEAGLSVSGFFDMRYAAAKYVKFLGNTDKNAIVVCVFECEISIVLVRNGAVVGSGVTSSGYGTIVEAIKKTFSVGHEEAKEIMRAFANKTLEAHVNKQVEDVCSTAGKALITEVSAVVPMLDRTSLLPGNIWVVSSEDLPQVDEAFRATEWLTPLPIERNATIHVWHAPEHDIFKSAFDLIIAETL